MKRYEKLTKFIPVLETEGLGKWVVTEDGGRAEPEYQEVVFRLYDAVEAFCEKTPPKDPAAAEVLERLLAIFKKEEAYPGVLIGYLENGAVVGLLRELAKK